MDITSMKWWKEFIVGNYYNLVLKKDWKVNDNFALRKWVSYDEYKKVQKAKYDYADISNQVVSFEKALLQRMQKEKKIFGQRNITNALCLGARDGTEVKVFRKLGLFAVGIDLNVGKDNEYVTTGDFHEIKFNNDSVDLIYSNSLDHSFDLTKVLIEIKNKLKKRGLFIWEAGIGIDEGGNYGLHESVYWKNLESLKELLSLCGFKIIEIKEINNPCNGYCIICEKYE